MKPGTPASAVLAVFACTCLGALAQEQDPALNARVGDRQLVLNGTAVRSVWGFSVYHIGLFLSERSGDENVIINENRAPKRVRITMLREVDKEQFTGTVRESIDRNFTDGEKRRFAAEIAAFFTLFHNGEGLKKGGVVTIDFLPEKGMVVAYDGSPLGEISGRDFYHAILRLWIGKPLQKSIKDGLLGKGG